MGAQYSGPVYGLEGLCCLALTMDGDFTLLRLFIQEVEVHSNALTRALLNLEEAFSQEQLESAMRAAHSIKGAGSIVSVTGAVRAAHLLEECFDRALKHRRGLWPEAVDVCLQAVDFLKQSTRLKPSQYKAFLDTNAPLPPDLEARLEACAQQLTQEKPPEPKAPRSSGPSVSHDELQALEGASSLEGIVRIPSHRLTSLMTLSAETLLQSKRLSTFGIELMHLKMHQQRLEEILTQIQEAVSHLPEYSPLRAIAQEARTRSELALISMSGSIGRHELIAEKLAWLSRRTYDAVMASRMRPFSDILEGLPRMVRDMARRLGKKISLKVTGSATPVDRDILELLESPFNHLIRNAIDHGIEPPQVRQERGKSEAGTLFLHARHQAGMLIIEISDDGNGIDLAWIRMRVLERGLVHADILPSLSKDELLQFLCLPGFSSRTTVTEFSGRGIGLNSVQDQIQKTGGHMTIATAPGQGSTFHLQLPITRSVVRALVTIVDSEPYAFPMNRIYYTLKLEVSRCHEDANGRYIEFENNRVPLVDVARIWREDHEMRRSRFHRVLVIHHKDAWYGLLVDRIEGERELVVQPLDKRLGTIPNLSATALMPEGPPVVLFDMDDLLQSITHLVSGSRGLEETPADKPRILVVDDSATVRESEGKILQLSGYQVDTAVDGADAWNALQTRTYDLIITDVDMPRLGGIELLKRLREEPRLANLPVILVSYKDRDVDIQIGHDAGADRYLTKSHALDTELLQSVRELLNAQINALE